MQDAPPDDDARDREALRSALPRPTADAADTLLAALHRSRLAASMFGETSEVKVDRYIVRRELGRGGMGVVFVAEDPLLAVPVALKLLQRGPQQPGDGAAESELQREAQALARVRGDHVVRVYSAGFFMGQPWIAMQLVDGPHLGEWLAARGGPGSVGWREVLARYVEAGRGLQAIHSAGLVHRDFKPQNAVVDADGCVRVLDFGLASAVGEHTSDDAPRLGTHRYAAPEQFLGRVLDPRSDQFSFCVALHEALCGAPPFGVGVSTGERLAHGPPVIVPRPAGELPGWLGAALQRGLAARPEDRHPDMAALLHELTRDRLRGLRIAALVSASFLAGGVFLFAFGGNELARPDAAQTTAASPGEFQLVARAALARSVVAHASGDRQTAEAALDRAHDQATDPALAVEILHTRIRRDLVSYHSVIDGNRDLKEAALKLEQVPPGIRHTGLLAEHRDLRGLLRFEARHNQDAITEYTAAIDQWKQLPPHPEVERHLLAALRHRASAHAAVSDLAAAITDNREALQLAIRLHGPEHPTQIYLDLARDHDSLGEQPEASAAATRARELLASRPDDTHTRCQIAETERYRGEPELAEETARKAVELAPADPQATPGELANCRYLLAMLALQNNRPDTDALLDDALAAMQNIPGPDAICDRSDLQLVRGLHAIRNGDDALAESLTHDPPPADCHGESLTFWVRAQIAAKRDQPELARQAYDDALKHDSDYWPLQRLELARLLHDQNASDPRIRTYAAEAAPELQRQGYAQEAAEAAELAR